MNRFYGKIGFAAKAVESARAGVYSEPIVERLYFGDVEQNVRQLRDDAQVNNNIFSDNRISVVADAYLFDNIDTIRYILWKNTPWIVSGVTVQEHRFICTLGGVYHGPRPATST